MKSDSIACRDVYLRHVDKSGHAHLVEHRVWDIDRFVQSQMAAAIKEGGRVEVVTQEQYRAARWPKRA